MSYRSIGSMLVQPPLTTTLHWSSGYRWMDGRMELYIYWKFSLVQKLENLKLPTWTEGHKTFFTKADWYNLSLSFGFKIQYLLFSYEAFAEKMLNSSRFSCSKEKNTSLDRPSGDALYNSQFMVLPSVVRGHSEQKCADWKAYS